MTLIEQADRLAVRLANFQTLKSLADEGRRFRTRAEQLSPPAAELLQLKAVERALREHGISTIFEHPAKSTLADRAAGLAKTFDENRKSVLATQPPLEHSFLKPLNALTTAFRAALEQSWRRHVEEVIRPMPEDLLAVLGAIRELAPQVAALRQQQSRGIAIAAALPEATAVLIALEGIRDVAAKKAESLEKLSGGGIPDEVLRFLRRSVTRQARLEELTTSIIDWLRARGLLRAFIVTPG